MAKHICLFGGPGSGKSTTASALFSKMKVKHYKVELVTEYAKDLVYSKDFMTLSDQIMVLAKQHHRWYKLEDQVDFTVSDAPFLLSCIFAQDKPHLDVDLLKKFIIDTYLRYDTINIFLEREDSHFQEYGRNESLEEAKELDIKIRQLMDYNNIPYVVIPFTKKPSKKIFKYLKEEGIL